MHKGKEVLWKGKGYNYL